MKKILKYILIIIILVLLVVGGLFVYKKFFNSNETDNKPVVEEAKKLDSIEGFSYVLYDNSTELYKSLYYELKDVLEATEIDYQKYAELVSKMFVSDFYNLNTKITNQDVGGLDFVYSGIRDNFKTKASDTLYKYIESNVYGDREQKLPEVIEIVSCEATVSAYKFSDDDISISDENGFLVKLTWKYKEDLGYQTSATIRLVHEDKVLSIVSID